MRTLYSNPNAKRRRVQTETVRRLPDNLATQADIDEAAADWQQAAYQDSLARRKQRTHMQRVALAARLIAQSPDKRFRPDGVTPQEFRDARRLKLTRTAKVIKK